MKNLLLILLLSISSTSFGQSFLGKTEKDVLKIATTKYKTSELSVEQVSDKYTFIKIDGNTETTYLHFINDICMEVVVSKKNINNSLSEEIENFSKRYVATGMNSWLSKDSMYAYNLTVQEDFYNISTIRYDNVSYVAPKMR